MNQDPEPSPGGVDEEPEDAGGTNGASTRRRRLDPERAAAARQTPRQAAPQVVDTRRYQRLIGLFGLLLVIVISVTFLTSRGVQTAGIPAGKHVPEFAAPLATATLNGAANLNPVCTEAKHNPGALNLCLSLKRSPLVLAFFVTSSSGCERQVTALQRVAAQTPAGQVKFAAVAVRSTRADAAKAVRRNRWTVPVAYDLDGRVGAAYGVEVCPIVELVRKGGVVFRRLIGNHWASAAALEPQVRALLADSG